MRPHGRDSVYARQHAEQAVTAILCDIKHLVLRSGAGGERSGQEAAFGQRLRQLFTARTAFAGTSRRGREAESRMLLYLCESYPSKSKHSVQWPTHGPQHPWGS